MDGWEKLIGAATQTTLVQLERAQRLAEHKPGTTDRRVIRLTRDGAGCVFDDIDIVLSELRLFWEEQGEETFMVEYTWMSQEEYARLPEFEGY